jgi:hypothetical protein
MELRTAPTTWATWSHGATPRVYFSGNSSTAVINNSETLTLPAGTGAFQFWAEPNILSTFTVTATANDGTTLMESINGNGGASGFGFFADPGQSILSITVSAPSAALGFGLAEFAISRTIPEPSTLALFGVGMASVLGYVARRRKKEA